MKNAFGQRLAVRCFCFLWLSGFGLSAEAASIAQESTTTRGRQDGRSNFTYEGESFTIQGVMLRGRQYYHVDPPPLSGKKSQTAYSPTDLRRVLRGMGASKNLIQNVMNDIRSHPNVAAAAAAGNASAPTSIRSAPPIAAAPEMPASNLAPNPNGIQNAPCVLNNNGTYTCGPVGVLPVAAAPEIPASNLATNPNGLPSGPCKYLDDGREQCPPLTGLQQNGGQSPRGALAR